MTFDIPAREACECPHPLPARSYGGLRACGVCGWLIPRSVKHANDLAARRYRRDRSDGLVAPRSQHLGTDEVRALVNGELRRDPGFTNTAAADMVSKAGAHGFSARKLCTIISEERAKLGIVARGGRRSEQACATPTCFRRVAVGDHCERCHAESAA